MEEKIMSERINTLIGNIRDAIKNIGTIGNRLPRRPQLPRCHGRIIAVSLLAFGAYGLYSHPAMQSVGRGEIGMRLNQLTGSSTEVRDGAILVIPGLHELRRFSLRDQVYRPTANISASGDAPFQSVEGLSIGVDIAVRYRS